MTMMQEPKARTVGTKSTTTRRVVFAINIIISATDYLYKMETIAIWVVRISFEIIQSDAKRSLRSKWLKNLDKFQAKM